MISLYINIEKQENHQIDVENNQQTNPTDIETNPTDIETNPTDIETNLTDIETNPTDIETNLTDIETNQQTNLTDIETNLTDIETNLTDIETNLTDSANQNNNEIIIRILYQTLQIFKDDSVKEITSEKVINELYATICNYLHAGIDRVYFSSVDNEFIRKVSFLVKPGGIIYGYNQILPNFTVIEGNSIRNSVIQFDDSYIGIKMPTHKRKNGNSPKYLQRSIEAIRQQTFSKWILFLCGDNYIDNHEFNSFANMDSRIIAINLPLSYDRELPIDPKTLWLRSGLTTLNYSIMFAEWHNIRYLAHTDDDDIWSRFHQMML